MGIMLQRTLPAGFIAPCLPTKTDKLPSGSLWLHEIKHDGFRVIARKDGEQVRLYSRPGNDLTHRFPLIVETLGRLRSRSCIIAMARWRMPSVCHVRPLGVSCFFFSQPSILARATAIALFRDPSKGTFAGSVLRG